MTISVRRSYALAAMCILTWVAATPARAAWTRPQTIVAPGARGATLAVDGRGDSVVAWASTRIVKKQYRSSVHVAVRSANGRLRTRRVWHRRHAEVFGVSAVIDRRGRISVAWEDWDRTDRLPSMVRAVFGTISGRFSRVQAVSRGGHDIGPVLAPAPNGTVLMVLKTGRSRQSREFFSVAWHRPGHRFGSPRALTDSSHAPIEFHPVSAAFDATGNAYVWGSCNASVLRAPAGSHRFGRPIVLAGQVLGFSLALNGPGDGLASWVAGNCSTGVMDGDVYGPVRASALQAGVFGPPVAVEPFDLQATGTQAIALPRREGLVVYGTPSGPTYAAPLSGDALAQPQDVSGLVPRAATRAGDLVLADERSASNGLTRALVRPAAGGEDAASVPAAQLAALAVPAIAGRAAAALWATGQPGVKHLRLSVWRP
jgi:hypothetical protein